MGRMHFCQPAFLGKPQKAPVGNIAMPLVTFAASAMSYNLANIRLQTSSPDDPNVCSFSLKLHPLVLHERDRWPVIVVQLEYIVSAVLAEIYSSDRASTSGQSR